MGEIPKVLWLFYDLEPNHRVTNVQIRDDGSDDVSPDYQFWWMTMFVGFRNKLLRSPIS